MSKPCQSKKLLKGFLYVVTWSPMQTLKCLTPLPVCSQINWKGID